jgi:hypothetical protein
MSEQNGLKIFNPSITVGLNYNALPWTERVYVNEFTTGQSTEVGGV